MTWFDPWPVMSSDPERGLCRASSGAAAGGAGGTVAMEMWGERPCPAGLRQLYELEKRPRCGHTHPITTWTAGTARPRPGRWRSLSCMHVSMRSWISVSHVVCLMFSEKLLEARRHAEAALCLEQYAKVHCIFHSHHCSVLLWFKQDSARPMSSVSCAHTCLLSGLWGGHLCSDTGSCMGRSTQIGEPVLSSLSYFTRYCYQI